MKSEKSLQDLIQNISHDLRTPLSEPLKALDISFVQPSVNVFLNLLLFLMKMQQI